MCYACTQASTRWSACLALFRLVTKDFQLSSRCASGAGKYTKDNLPGGARALVINEERVNAVQPLLGLMRDIGSAHGGKTPGQVILG